MTESITTPSPRHLRLAVAGGGTGGHVSPIVAVIEHLRRTSVVDALWIGSREGFERDAAARLAIEYVGVRTGKLRRYASLSTFADAVRVPVGVFEAWRALRHFRPDVIFSSGGFVSVPTVIAGRALRIPAITHEQTAYLGLATRINSRFCDVVALSFRDSTRSERLGNAKVVVTGNPVREIAAHGDPAELSRRCTLQCDRPLIYVTGGAQGAHALNEVIERSLPELLERAEILHQCGPLRANGDIDRAFAAADRLPSTLRSRYHPVESIQDEIGHVFAAASLVIGRAGAGTIAELASVGKPSILVPLPGAEEQRRNALVLVTAGGAILIPESELTPVRLVAEVTSLLADQDRLSSMGISAGTAMPAGATERLVREIEILAGSRHRVAGKPV